MVTTGLRPRRSAVLRLLVVALALAGALLGRLGGAAPASAHAALTGSTPAQGSVADRAEQVTLTFSEGVAMGDDSIRVLDPQGKRVDDEKLRNLSSDRVVKYGAGLPSGLRDGTYTVAWQAVSADSHPVSGAFTFSIGAPSKTSAPFPNRRPAAAWWARSTASPATWPTPGSCCWPAAPPSWWPAGPPRPSYGPYSGWWCTAGRC